MTDFEPGTLARSLSASTTILPIDLAPWAGPYRIGTERVRATGDLVALSGTVHRRIVRRRTRGQNPAVAHPAGTAVVPLFDTHLRYDSEEEG